MTDVSTPGPVGPREAGGGGRRLAAAFESVSRLPTLAEARRRLLSLCERESATAGEITEAVESDAGLAIAVMRAANNGSGPSRRTGGVRKAIESLDIDRVRTLAAGLDTYDLLDHPGSRADSHERFRRHAVAVRNAAERIGEVARLPEPDELAIAALLHDVGRLVLVELYGEELLGNGRYESPDERVRRERRELGIDHALVGGVLTRRWGLAPAITSTIERHHASDAEGAAAVIALADQVAHHSHGDPVSADRLAALGAGAGVEGERLTALLYEFPHAHTPRKRAPEPCPLSGRELDALRGLAEGKVYKEIAEHLSLSASTVRTHLHNVYRKLGAIDRAQAVLIARDRGWI
jgi:putative nucleotidyltransferase with HDIG domain